MASLASTAGDPPPGDDRLELHVRCVAGEEKMAVSVSLWDGSTVALNRCAYNYLGRIGDSVVTALE